MSRRATLVNRLPRKAKQRCNDHGYTAAYDALGDAIEAVDRMATNLGDSGMWSPEEDAHAAVRLLEQARKRLRLVSHAVHTDKKKPGTTQG